MHQRRSVSVFRNKPIRKTFRSLFSVFLLAIYSVGTVGVDLLHHSIHNHHESEVHTAIAEKDPCHRSLFHGDVTDGCHHKAHFTNTENCKFSHVVFEAQQESTNDPATDILTENTQVICGYHASLTAASVDQPHLRGPPVA